MNKIKGQDMFDPKIFDDFAKKISEGLPSGVKNFQEEMEKNVKTMLQNGIAKLDLVTREEFEVQTQVLARTRSKVDELEVKVAQLEQQQEKPVEPVEEEK